MGGTQVCFSESANFYDRADVVISSTSAPHKIIEKEDVQNKTGKDKTVFVDLANPRDISSEIEEIDGIKLYDLDDLNELMDSNEEEREKEIEKAEGIVVEEAKRLVKEIEKLEVEETLKQIYKKVESIRKKEVNKAMSCIEKEKNVVDGVEKKVIDRATKSIVKKILHDPVSNMNRAWEKGEEHVVESAEYLFDLN